MHGGCFPVADLECRDVGTGGVRPVPGFSLQIHAQIVAEPGQYRSHGAERAENLVGPVPHDFVDGWNASEGHHEHRQAVESGWCVGANRGWRQFDWRDRSGVDDPGGAGLGRGPVEQGTRDRNRSRVGTFDLGDEPDRDGFPILHAFRRSTESVRGVLSRNGEHDGCDGFYDDIAGVNCWVDGFLASQEHVDRVADGGQFISGGHAEGDRDIERCRAGGQERDHLARADGPGAPLISRDDEP